MMTTRKHGVRTLLLLLTAMMIAVMPVMAETTHGQDSPYRIVLVAPGGWTSNNGATVKASVTDTNRIGWYRIEYRMNQSAWIDCEDLFDQNKAEITVHENGIFTLRVTDPQGQTHEETAKINSIDLTAPSLTASVNGSILRIDTRDDMSGIAGVQINSMLFTAVVNNVLDVELDRNMNRYEKLAIRAFDYAGNFSEPLTLTDPHYVKPADPTPTPSATPAPTAAPTETPIPSAAPVEAFLTAAPTAAPESHYRGLGSSLIYVPDEDWPTPTPVPTAVPTPEPIIETEYIVIGPGMPYQADGNSHTLDVLYSAATNKQFITIQTKSGNTFYLVIDYDKPIDEAAEMYETYFLNLVDERDLMSLMSDEEIEQVPTPTPEIIYVTPEPTAVPAATVTPPAATAAPAAEPVDETKKTDQMTGILGLVGILALGGVGAFVFLRSKGKGSKRSADNDFDLDDDDADEDNQKQE